MKIKQGSRKGYTLDDKYDLEEVYDKGYTDTDEERLHYRRDKRITRICLKTTISGDMLESECYPVWDTQLSIRRAPKSKKSRKAQRNLNNKNAIKAVVRLINANFVAYNDLWFTGTFDEGSIPPTWLDTNRYAQNFIRRLDRYAQKHGFPELKYIYVSVHTEDKRKKERAHVHVVTNFPDRDVMEALWHKGAKKKKGDKKEPFVGRTQTRRLQPDEFGFEGLARYIANNAHGTRRYTASKNLKTPIVKRAYCRMTRGRLDKIVRGNIDAKDAYERIYKGYMFTDLKHFISDYVSGDYLYVRMRRQN